MKKTVIFSFIFFIKSQVLNSNIENPSRSIYEDKNVFNKLLLEIHTKYKFSTCITETSTETQERLNTINPEWAALYSKAVAPYQSPNDTFPTNYQSPITNHQSPITNHQETKNAAAKYVNTSEDVNKLDTDIKNCPFSPRNPRRSADDDREKMFTPYGRQPLRIDHIFKVASE